MSLGLLCVLRSQSGCYDSEQPALVAHDIGIGPWKDLKTFTTTKTRLIDFEEGQSERLCREMWELETHGAGTSASC